MKKATDILASSQTLAAEMARRVGRKPTCLVPLSFVAFCIWIGVTLHPGQLVFSKVVFDGVEPKDLEGGEREIARELFGDVEVISPEARSTYVAVCGGRGGKTYVFVALRLVWGMFIRDLSSVAPGQHPAALVVAPNDALRQEAVNYAIGAIRSKPELRETLVLPKGTGPDDVVSSFSVRRPDGKVVDFVAGVCTRGGYAARGRAWTDAVLDECAFFRDASYKVNDKDIFDAAKARVLPGGQSGLTSTPWAEAGLLFDEFKANYGAPKSAIAAQAPTLTLNPSPMARALVDRETKKDPENAAREYGARFMKGGTTVFFAPDLIESCVDDALLVDVPVLPRPGDEVAAGGDLGFRSDSAALAITHNVKSGERKGQLVLAELVEKQVVDGVPLKPNATIREFRERMRAHGATVLMADQHYIETAREVLDEEKMSVLDAPATPDDVYVRARQRMREGLVRIPRHDRLIRQLKEVQGKPLPGGRMQIILPRWAKGGHGDNVSAFVLGLWQLAPDVVAQKTPDETSAEAELARKKARYEKFQAETTQKHWERPGGAPDRGPNAFWRRQG